jgi:hypothetical protein
MARFMREKRIVILDLSPRNRLSPQLADTFAGLFFNELLTTARSLPRSERYETYCWLDEFQRMVGGPDLEFAIPEVRQLGIRLILAHQSFSQLVRGDSDLSSIIWQPQTRLMFGNQGEDADLLAHELASITYDPRRIKDELYSRRQLVTDHRIIDLASWSNVEGYAKQWQDQYGRSASTSQQLKEGIILSDGRSATDGQSHGRGESETHSTTHGSHQSLLPVYEQFLELSKRTYYTFDEHKQTWARDVRKLKTGVTALRIVDDDEIRVVKVQESKPGPLAFSDNVIHRKFPELIDAYTKLIEENFAQRDFFLPPSVIEAEREERLERVLRPVITIQSKTDASPFP